MGYILLEGGAEFGGQMQVPDRQAIFLAGGVDARLSIIPAAAAPDNNHENAGLNGVRWFQGLGATEVAAVPLIDRSSADAPEVVEALRESRLIYMLGGFPQHLGQSLMGSLAWRAMKAAFQQGAVIAGSSAGAMVLCEHYYSPRVDQVVKGLGLIPGSCVLPHHDTYGKTWAPQLAKRLPGTTLVGIDEETGIMNDGPAGQWQVYGKGTVTLYKEGGTSNHGPEQPFALES
jgi:cyanophycinase